MKEFINGDCIGFFFFFWVRSIASEFFMSKVPHMCEAQSFVLSLLSCELILFFWVLISGCKAGLLLLSKSVC